MSDAAPLDDEAEAPAPCGRCGMHHWRMGRETCRAHRTNGLPCLKFRRPGMVVCERHGGKAPQAVSAAQRRAAEANALNDMRKLMSAEVVSAGLEPEDLPYVDPIQNLLWLVSITTQSVDALAERVAELAMPDPDDHNVGDMRDFVGVDDAGNPIHLQPRSLLYGPNLRGELVTHPLYQEWKAMMTLNARFSKMAIEANVAERMSRMNDAMAEAIAMVVDLALADLHLPSDVRSEAKLRVSMRMAELDRPGAVVASAVEKPGP